MFLLILSQSQYVNNNYTVLFQSAEEAGCQKSGGSPEVL